MNIWNYRICFFKLTVSACIAYYCIIKFIISWKYLHLSDEQDKVVIKVDADGSINDDCDSLTHSTRTLNSKGHGGHKSVPVCCYLSINTVGRFGNQLGEYAALYGLAKTNPYWKPYLTVDGHQSIKQAFKNTLSIKTLSIEPENNSKFNLFENKYSNASDSICRFKSWPLRNTTLIGYPGSWKFFHGFEKDIKKEFQFSQEIQTNVHEIFKSLTPKEWEHLNFTRVGIHVRRGDWNTVKRREQGYYVPDRSYFQHAMDYFNQRFERVQFIVISEDMAWTKANIRGKHVVYPHEKSLVDFALMAMSDHMITSIGSFSNWAGKLCDGIKVYPGTLPPQGTFRRRELDNGDVHPKDWIPII